MISKAKVSIAVALTGIGLSAVSLATTNANNYPTKMNSAYTYDLTYDCSAGKGMMPDNLNKALNADGAQKVSAFGMCHETWDQTIPQSILGFNSKVATAAGAKATQMTGINQLYIYGTDMEVYENSSKAATDPANIGTEASLTTTDFTLAANVNKVPLTTADYATKPDPSKIYSGEHNLTNYIDQLGKTASNKVNNISIIIDGRHDNLGVFGGFLGQYNNEFGNNDVSINNWTQAYATKQAQQVLVDGFVDPKSKQKYLGVCQSLDKAQAYADKTYPNSHIKLGGMQFDLESFHLPSNTTDAIVCDGSANAPADCGQYYFYMAVKHIFETNTVCSQLHPYFSTFIMAGSLLNSNGDVTPEAKAIFANSPDSYAAISLYDLGAAGGAVSKYTSSDTTPLYPDMANAGMNTVRAGFVASAPDYYNTAVAAEIAKMSAIDAAGIHYQFGIPLSASAHEFDGFKIQAPNPTGVYYATAQSGQTGMYIPNMADADASLFDSAAAPADDTTQSQYVSDVLEAIENYVLTQNPKNYMGLTLWSFQPQDGNHWAPRNMYKATDGTTVNPNEYYLFNPYPKSTDKPYTGYVNMGVYMRLYTPNSICSTADSTSCPVDEQNVWGSINNVVQNPTYNVFQVNPVILWSNSLDDIIPDATYAADGSFSVKIHKGAQLLPNVNGYPLTYQVTLLNNDKTKVIDECPMTGTGDDVVATCHVDSADIQAGLPVNLAVIAYIPGQSEITEFDNWYTIVPTPTTPSVYWASSDKDIVTPVAYNSDGTFTMSIHKGAIITPNPSSYPVDYKIGVYNNDTEKPVYIGGCTQTDSGQDIEATCQVDPADVSSSSPIRVVVVAALVGHSGNPSVNVWRDIAPADPAA